MTLPPPLTVFGLILQVLRKAADSDFPVTPSSLLKEIRHSIEQHLQTTEHFPPYWERIFFYQDVYSEQAVEYVKSVLKDLAELGLAKPLPYSSRQEQEWKLAGSWPKINGGDVSASVLAGFGEEPPDQPPGGQRPGFPDNPEDGEGGGFGQVLAHPYLFTVDDKEFRDILERTLGDGN